MKGLIIIPTYNESKNIERLVKDILAHQFRLEILVVDDNSPDGTGEIAEKLSQEFHRIHVLRRSNKMGLGSAYIAGFRFARSRDYNFIFQMDADFSHDPKHLSNFIEEVKNYDFVIGSRYVNGGRVVNWPWHRLFLSYFANLYARVITGIPVKDTTTGFNCFRREVLDAMDLDAIIAEGYGFAIEVKYKSWRQGFSLKEIPIVFVERSAGTTKMSKAIIFEAMWIVWKLRFQAIMGTL